MAITINHFPVPQPPKNTQKNPGLPLKPPVGYENSTYRAGERGGPGAAYESQTHRSGERGDGVTVQSENQIYRSGERTSSPNQRVDDAIKQLKANLYPNNPPHVS